MISLASSFAPHASSFKNAKKLFQDRLEKPRQKQGAFFHQHRGTFRRHGRGDNHRAVDMG